MLGFLIAITSCSGGGGGGNVPPFNANVNGSWSGDIEFHNLLLPTTLDMFIIQSGTTLTSKFVEFNFNFGGGCVGSGSMTGSVNGDNLTMSIAGNSSVPSVTLTATSSVDTISGTFTTSGACDSSDQGNFTLGLIPSIASSQWAGNITAGAALIPLTANIKEDQAGNLTGTVSLSSTTASCSTISVTGNQFGRQAHIINLQQGLLDASGEIAADRKSISGGADGSCIPGGVGQFSMTRP